MSSRQCAVGRTGLVVEPLVVNVSGVVQAAMGDFHLLVRLGDGKTLECGKYRTNDDIGDHTVLAEARRVGSLKAKQVAAGGAMAMVLLDDGNVFTWATNSTPANFMTVGEAAQCGAIYSSIGPGGAYKFAYVVTASGDVHVCGRDFHCRLGIGPSHGHTQYGMSWVADESPARVSALEGRAVRGIAMHEFQAIAYGEDFTPLAWGRNADGVLGLSQEGVVELPTPMDFRGEHVVSVDLAADHGVAVTASGAVWTWGSDSLGQCAGGRSRLPSCVTAIGGYYVHHAVALNGATVCFSNSMPALVLTLQASPVDDDGVAAVAFLNMAGEEVISLKLNLGRETLGMVRRALAERLNTPVQQLQLLAPTGGPDGGEAGAGRLLHAPDDEMPIGRLLDLGE